MIVFKTSTAFYIKWKQRGREQDSRDTHTHTHTHTHRERERECVREAACGGKGEIASVIK